LVKTITGRGGNRAGTCAKQGTFLILTYPLERTERMEMTVRRAKTDRKEAPDEAHHLSGWQLVAALGIIAVGIIATLLIMQSPRR
jgi:hypothetical protein